MTPELSRQWTSGPFNFSSLDGESFERLMMALLAAEGYEAIRHLGQRGTDDGVDLRARYAGKTVAVQCKAWKKLPLGEARKEFKDFLERNSGFDRYLLVVAGTSSMKKVLDAMIEVARNMASDATVAVDLWTGSELNLLATKHPKAVAEVLRRESVSVADSPSSKTVYLSATRADRDWAAIFRQDLETALQHAVHGDWQVQWQDPKDHDGLPEVPDNASWGLVVVTPESLADRRLMEVWKGALSQGAKSGRRRLLAVSVVAAEWPSWLPERFERIDLQWETVPSPKEYHRDLSALVHRWTDRAEPELFKDLQGLEFEGPPPEPERLPHALRSGLVDWLVPVMERDLYRRALATELGFKDHRVLDHDFETGSQRASAALVLARGDDDPVVAALRLIDVVSEALKKEESAQRLAQLEAMAEKLRRHRQATPAAETKGLLAAWLQKLEQDHEHVVDYFQRRHELDLLDQVYVELELTRSDVWTEDQAEEFLGRDDLAHLRSAQALSMSDVLNLDPDRHSWVTRRWVVRGDPGSGKTTLLRHLAAKLAKDWQPGSRVPIFQSLPVLLRSKLPLLDQLEASLQKTAGLQGLGPVLDREGQEGRLLLLLDGLDEVGDARADAEGLIRYLAERWPRSPVVITTRPIGYRRFATGFRELQLLPFNHERQHNFLACWFGRAKGRPDEKRARKALAELADARLADLSGNPLYLTLMAMLLEQGTSPSKNRSKLYDQVFDLLLSGKHKHGSVEPIEGPDLVRRTLRLLAFTMTLDNRDREPASLLLERLYRDEFDPVRERLRKKPHWDANLKNFLDDLAKKVGILGPHDGTEADWSYWHRTFREALCAEHLKGLPRNETLAFAENLEKGGESRWAEPYALLTGMVEKPDDLLHRLVKSNRSLGLRALATAQSVSDATLDEILSLTEKWQERSEVYEQLPDLIGEAERALQMIDRLRSRFRGGNDLFFLDVATAKVGELDSDSVADARRLQERFYRQLPVPEDFKTLFTTFQKPNKGEVDLWCKIPKGEGWIGSPEEEKGRLDWEGPRHQVEILRPFWLAAVPVTNAQYACFDPTKPFETWEGVPEEGLAHHPRVNVTWYEAMAFCHWLGMQPGFEGVRLPTEEEWEYACRAGTETRYWKDDSEAALAEVGWYINNSGRRTHPVGEKAANPWGLYDMHGNVWEWTASAWKDDYSDQTDGLTVDPTIHQADFAGPPRAHRVRRGGSYRDTARLARSAFRNFWYPWIEVPNLGFRLLLPRRPERL